MKQFHQSLNILISLTLALAPFRSSADTLSNDIKTIGEFYQKEKGRYPDEIYIEQKNINGVTVYHAKVNYCEHNGSCTQVANISYRESYGLMKVDGQYIKVRTIDSYEGDKRIVSSSPAHKPSPPRVSNPKRIDYSMGYSNSGKSLDPESLQGGLQMRIRPPTDLRVEFEKALPAVTSAVSNSYQDMQRAMQTSQAMHEAYKNNLASVSRFTQAAEVHRQNVEKNTQVGDSLATAILSKISKQIDTSSTSLENTKELNRFEAVKNDPFAFRRYEFTPAAENELYENTDSSLEKRNLRALARNVEMGISQVDNSKVKAFEDKYKNVVRDGLIQTAALNPHAGASPLDKRKFGISAQTPAGQALRRTGNMAQALWSEQNGFQHATDQSKAAYVAGLVSLSSAESSFLNGDNEQGFSELVASSKFLQASVGFTKGLYAAGKDAVMAYPMMVEAVYSLSAAIAEDPSSVVDKAADLIVKTPEIGAAIVKATKDYGQKFIDGDAETRGEIIGRVTGEVVINFYSGGATRAIRGVKIVGEIESKVGKAAQLLKPSSALGEAVYRKAVELEPHISEAYILIQKSLSPGNSLDKKVELITDSYSRVKMFSAQILPEVIKERRLLIEIRNGYNAEVLKITKYINEAKIGGETLENIARKANQMRRSAGEYYKNKTPELIRKEIYKRNMIDYKDELGPTFEEMVKEGLAEGQTLDSIYNEIIKGSQRTNKDLNIFLEVLAKEIP